MSTQLCRVKFGDSFVVDQSSACRSVWQKTLCTHGENHLSKEDLPTLKDQFDCIVMNFK